MSISTKTRKTRLSIVKRFLPKFSKKHVAGRLRVKLTRCQVKLYENVQGIWDLEGAFYLALCVSKTIVTLRHTNPIICQDKRQNLRF
eukprot:UN24797